SENEWKEWRVDKMPQLKEKLFVGIKYGHDGTNVSMSIAVKTVDDKIFVEAIDCQSIRNGNDWIIHFLRNADVQTVVVDCANGQKILADAMKLAGLRPPILPTDKEVIQAYALFEQTIYQKTI